MLSKNMNISVIDEDGRSAHDINGLVGFAKKKMDQYVDLLNSLGQQEGRKSLRLTDGTIIDLKPTEYFSKVQIRIPVTRPTEQPVPPVPIPGGEKEEISGKKYIRKMEIFSIITPEFLWKGETGYVITADGHLTKDGPRKLFLYDDLEEDDEYGKHYHDGSVDYVNFLRQSDNKPADGKEFRHCVYTCSIYTILDLFPPCEEEEPGVG